MSGGLASRGALLEQNHLLELLKLSPVAVKFYFQLYIYHPAKLLCTQSSP